MDINLGYRSVDSAVVSKYPSLRKTRRELAMLMTIFLFFYSFGAMFVAYPFLLQKGQLSDHLSIVVSQISSDHLSFLIIVKEHRRSVSLCINQGDLLVYI